MSIRLLLPHPDPSATSPPCHHRFLKYIVYVSKIVITASAKEPMLDCLKAWQTWRKSVLIMKTVKRIFLPICGYHSSNNHKQQFCRLSRCTQICRHYGRRWALLASDGELQHKGSVWEVRGPGEAQVKELLLVTVLPGWLLLYITHSNCLRHVEASGHSVRNPSIIPQHNNCGLLVSHVPVSHPPLTAGTIWQRCDCSWYHRYQCIGGIKHISARITTGST